MSLKAVHILVILTSILACLGLGGWEVAAWWRGTGGTVDLVLGAVAVGVGLTLCVYFKAALHKLRDISYL